MALTEESDGQLFQSLEGALLAILPTHFCPETDMHFLNWSDIQHALKDIHCLIDNWGDEVPFMLDSYGELYAPAYLV